jgi:acyl carrier protein
MDTLQEFIDKLKTEFGDDYDVSNIDENTKINEIDWWSSMHALIIIALIDSEYDIIIEPEELKNAHTITDLYNVVKNKLS